MNDHFHTPGDGRGPRKVLVDGREVRQIVYADTKRGVVLQRVGLNGRRRRVVRQLFRSIRGVVEVIPC